MIGTNPYMSRHRTGVPFSWSLRTQRITNPIVYFLKRSFVLVILRVRRLPDDGTPVPKYVGVGTYHELGFIMFVVFY